MPVSCLVGPGNLTQVISARAALNRRATSSAQVGNFFKSRKKDKWSSKNSFEGDHGLLSRN